MPAGIASVMSKPAAAGGGGGSLAFDTVSAVCLQTHSNLNTNVTAAHTLSASATLALLLLEASVEAGSDAGWAWTTLSLGGTNFTQLPSALRHSNDATSGFCDIWYIINPPTGAQTLSITPNVVGVHGLIARCVSITGALNATPFDTAVTAALGGGTPITLPITSMAAGDIAIGCAVNGSSAPGVTTGTSISVDTGDGSSGSHGGLRIARNAGTGTVNLAFSVDGGDWSAASGVRVRAA